MSEYSTKDYGKLWFRSKAFTEMGIYTGEAKLHTYIPHGRGHITCKLCVVIFRQIKTVRLFMRGTGKMESKRAQEELFSPTDEFILETSRMECLMEQAG